MLDFLVFGLFDGLAGAAVGEGEVAVLEELFEPVVELVGIDAALSDKYCEMKFS